MEKRDFSGGHSEGKAVEELVKTHKEDSIESEAKNKSIFGDCNTFDDIDARIKSLPAGAEIRRSDGKRFDLTFVETAASTIKNNGIIPTRIMGVITGSEGLRDAIARAVKSDFESENSFDRCVTIDDLITRVENVIRQNIVLAEFGLPQISLTTRDGGLLILTAEPPRMGIIEFLKEVRGSKYTLAQVKSSPLYSLFTSKYQLRAALDRVLS